MIPAPLDNIRILVGDCRETLKTLPEKSVQCCVTSPPYFGLRDYRVAGQIGLEPTPDEYVREMVAVFAEVRRVLKDDGVLWLNLGDSYASVGKWGGASGGKHVSELHGDSGVGRGKRDFGGLKNKDLIGIPWRVAFALQADGWYLRAACPWIKRNGMCESVQDRPTQTIESIFMLTKSKKNFYDAQSVRMPAKDWGTRERDNFRGGTEDPKLKHAGLKNANFAETGRLRRSRDWFMESFQGMLQDEDGEPMAFLVNTTAYKGAHFATFPPKLVEPCVLSSTSEKGECPQCGKAWERVVEKTSEPDPSYKGSTFDGGKTGARDGGDRTQAGERFLKATTGWHAQCTCGHNPVPQTILDPFGGSGTTALVATQHGRRAILCELNADYVNLARKRCGLPEDLDA